MLPPTGPPGAPPLSTDQGGLQWVEVGPHPGRCPSKAPLSLPAAWASSSLTLCGVSRNHPSPWHFTPCSVGRALTRGSEGPGAAGVSCGGGGVGDEDPRDCARVFELGRIPRAALSWDLVILAAKCPLLLQGGSRTGESPSEMSSGPTSRTRAAVSSAWPTRGPTPTSLSCESMAVMGGARGGGGSCRFSVSLALHIVPPTPNPIQKVWGHAQTCLSAGPVHLHVKRVSRQPHASWWCLRQARAAPDVGVGVDAWPGGRDPVRGREFCCECFGVRCPGHPPWS